MMWFVIGLLVGLLAAATPALYNLLLGGKEAAINSAGGIPLVGDTVSLLTILGVLAFIMGIVTFKPKMMLGAILLLVFAPHLAPLLTPLPQPVTQTQTTQTTSPSVPQVNPCIIDPYEMCYDEIAPYLQKPPAGTYSTPLGFNMPGTFSLIETDCGFQWAGQLPQSIFLTEEKECPAKRIYIYTTLPDSILRDLMRAFGGSSSYTINIKVIKQGFLFEQNVWEYTYEGSRPNSEFGRVTLLYVIDEKKLREIEEKIEPGEEYKLIITHRYYSLLGFRYENVITLKVFKKAVLQSTTTTIVTQTQGQTTTTWRQDFPRTHMLSITSPSVDPTTGLNIHLIESIISVVIGILSAMVMTKQLRGR